MTNIYCLSGAGPCEKQCDRCLAELEIHNRRKHDQRIADAINLLVAYGYTVTVKKDDSND